MALGGPTDKRDCVVLRVPRGKDSLPVIRVVLGGVASRHALPIDRLEDLVLAVETIFREESTTGEPIELTLSVEEETFKITMAGLCSQLVRQTLSETSGPRPDELGRTGVLRLLMTALVDTYRTRDAAAGDSFSFEMEKRIH